MRFDVDLESIVRKRNAGKVSWGFRHECEADSVEQAAATALEVARLDLRPSETIVKSTASVWELDSEGKRREPSTTLRLLDY